MQHLIWQMASDYLAVTENLTRRHMHFDNHFRRCGEDDESVNHALFECPPALLTWELASIPSCLGTFPISSVYTNRDYLFWRKSDIQDPNLDRDTYPWIIWYLWKARNDKLLKGITREVEELIKHAQSECNVWFEGNQKSSDDEDPPHDTSLMVISPWKWCQI